MQSSKTKVRVMISETHNPWFNLATEDWIFREMDPSAQTLFLWRNENTVVIGRNQNPWSECNLLRMEAEGVLMARRTSGGGAVFQDLGNSIYTFLSPREGYDRSVNNGIILRALARFGIMAELSGRNDIVVPGADGPRKISGAAFRETRDRAFHHGTVLINTDLTRLQNFLTPHPKKLQSKGAVSVRSRVMNLNEINQQLNHNSLCTALIEEFFAHHGSRCEIEILDQKWLEGVPELKEKFEHLSSWNWRFGHAPEFHHEMCEYLSWGFVQIFIDSENGHISRAQIFSDSLFPDLIEGLEVALLGKPYSNSGINEAIEEMLRLATDPTKALAAGSADYGVNYDLNLRELEAWLQTQIEL
jgi:lipoate-protein ligase A